MSKGQYLRPGFWIIDKETQKRKEWVPPTWVQFIIRKPGTGKGGNPKRMSLLLLESIENRKNKGK